MMASTAEVNIKNDLEKLKLEVQIKFEKIREALNVREKLLLRQIDVILTSQEAPVSFPADHEIKLLTSNEDDILNAIRSFGKFNLDSINLALQSIDSYMKNEDYIAPAVDHETMYKRLENRGTLGKRNTEFSDNSKTADEESEAIVVDFSHNKKLIRDNVSIMNESIINITLNEAKDLILKAKLRKNSMQLTMPPLNLEALDEALESVALSAESDLPLKDSVTPELQSTPPNTKSSQTVGGNKKERMLKPKITINNCNGTINLKNISNLTINCANEDAVRAEIPLPGNLNDNQDRKPNVPSTSITSPSASTSSSAASISPSSITSNEDKKVKDHAADSYKDGDQGYAPRKNNTNTNSTGNSALQYDFDDEDNSINCEFYNRLLNEIKKSLKQKTNSSKIDNQQYQSFTNSNISFDNNKNSNSQSTGSASSSSQCNNKNRKLVLKNFENLKIILESNDDIGGVEGGGGVGDKQGGNLHPVQIEQWLAEIISETEIEPIQNTDILEHSKIHKGMC